MEKKLAWSTRHGPPPNWNPAEQLRRLAKVQPRADPPGGVPEDP